MQKTEATVREILAATNTKIKNTDANADLFNDAGLTSVNAITMLAILEETFNISVPDDQYIKCRTIAQLTAMVDSLLEHAVV